MNHIPSSELILNADGSVYHLKLLPEDVADTIITVGDPDRVSLVSRHFDHIEIKKEKREFSTHTGSLKGKRITVISTGIGVGNIDILMNELDALVNIDLKNRVIKPKKKVLNIIRLGTAGCLQPSIPLDSLVVSRYAIGMDGLLDFYSTTYTEIEKNLRNAFVQHVFPMQPEWKAFTYAIESTSPLLNSLQTLENTFLGITLTLGGFYAPQGRQLRIPRRFPQMISQLQSFEWEENKIINLEMETAALYGLSSLLGHHCCSVSTLVAHRHFQKFSENPEELVNQMIEKVLGLLVEENSFSL